MRCAPWTPVSDNFEANFWGLYANNRLPQAEPYAAPLMAYAAKARRQAAFYNCSDGKPCRGLHYPGKIAPFGFDATFAGEPWASMSDHSNAVFAALNMVAQWEYGRNRTFLERTAFPFCRDALLFYQGWMRRRPGGSWVNENDQANECNPTPPITEARKRLQCCKGSTCNATQLQLQPPRLLVATTRSHHPCSEIRRHQHGSLQVHPLFG